jgi:hypothetical protein
MLGLAYLSQSSTRSFNDSWKRSGIHTNSQSHLRCATKNPFIWFHVTQSHLIIEEIDALLSLIAAKEYRNKLPTVGNRAKWLKAHKQQNGDTVPYFQYTQLHLEQLLLKQRDAMVTDIKFGSVAPWEIPRIKAVHVLPSSIASFLSRKRQIS